MTKRVANSLDPNRMASAAGDRSPNGPESEHQIEVMAAVASAEPWISEDLVDLTRWYLSRREEQRPWSVNILLTDNAHLSSLHGSFLSDTSVTDIMTFPFSEPSADPLEESEPGGEIVISIEQAVEQAADAGWPVGTEIEYLVLHGLLHLSGWHDETANTRAAMLDEQDRLLRQWTSRSAIGSEDSQFP